MTNHISHKEMILGLTADALIQARIVKDHIFDVVLPEIAPQRRSVAEAVKRTLARGDMFTEDFLCELDILIEFIDREISSGIQSSWVADEYNVDGGHYVRHLNARSQALSRSFGHLDGLHDAISQVVDFTEAGRVVETLFQQ